MKPLQLGIIGTGIAARDIHLPALDSLKDKIEIAAVCNHTEEKAKSFAKLAGDVPYVLDYKELLAMPHIEAVDIVLPIHLNYQAVKDALEAGKHVITEKPIAARLEEAEEMKGFPEKYPQVMMVAEHFRYLPAFIRIKEIIEANEIGEPYFVKWDVFRHLNQNNKYFHTKWRINHQYPGGFVTDGGIHNTAAIRFLLGDFDYGTALTQCINPAIGEIDTFNLQFVLKRGTHGELNLFYTAIKYHRSEFVVLGTEGSVMYKDNKVVLMKPDEEDVEEFYPYQLGYRGEFENLYNAIRKGEKVISTFEEAYKDLEVLVRALENTGEKTGLNL